MNARYARDQFGYELYKAGWAAWKAAGATEDARPLTKREWRRRLGVLPAWRAVASEVANAANKRYFKLIPPP